MKVLLIITDYGSFNNFLGEVAVQLINAGNEVHIICSPLKVINYEDKYPYAHMGIKIHYINFPRSYNFFKQVAASKKINKKIREISPDLINIHFTTGIFTTLVWRKPSFPVIGTIHGLGYPIIKGKLKRRIFKAIEKFCFKRLDRIFLINEFDYRLVKSLYPHKTFKYDSFGVGCDLKKFNSGALLMDDMGGLRNNLSIQKDDFVLAYTGRFVAFKGFHTVVKAVLSCIYDAGFADIKLLLIGGEDLAHSTGLTQAEQELYKKSPNILLVGFTPHVNQYLALANAFVFPSVKEGMPVCIMEALAMGVPVITSNTRGCHDLVKDNFNGLLLSDKPSIAETKEAILKLYHDRILLNRLSRNALLKRADLSRDRYVKNQIEVYRNLFTYTVPVTHA